MNLRTDAFQDQGLAQPEYDRDEAKTSFTAVARYTLAFLNTYLKKDEKGRSFLKQSPALNGIPKHLAYPQVSPASGLATTLRALRAEVEKQGYSHASEIYTNARQADPAYRVDEKGLLAWGGGELLDQGRSVEAIEVFKLAVAMYPDSASGYSSLGAAYQKTGQKSLAVQNFRRALELNPQDYFAIHQLSVLR